MNNEDKKDESPFARALRKLKEEKTKDLNVPITLYLNKKNYERAQEILKQKKVYLSSLINQMLKDIIKEETYEK